MQAALPSPESPLGFGTAPCCCSGLARRCARSELVGLRIGDVQLVPGRGVTVLVRRSKTDQYGRGQQVAIWANPADLGTVTFAIEAAKTARQSGRAEPDRAAADDRGPQGFVG